MDWFGWRLSKDPDKAVFDPQAILQILDKRVPQYLDDVDQGKLIYPACKRKPSDAHGDVRSIWDHTRLEAIRYVTMVPRREFEPLADPSRQTEMLEAYLRTRASAPSSHNGLLLVEYGPRWTGRRRGRPKAFSCRLDRSVCLDQRHLGIAERACRGSAG